MSASVLDALGLSETDTSIPQTFRGSHSPDRDYVEDILAHHETGKTQEHIAAVVGCAQSTVSRVLSKYRPTVDMAAKVLESKALTAALRVVDMMDSRNDRVVLESSKTILGANNLLGDSKSSTTNNIQVVIGMPALEQVLASVGVNQAQDAIEVKP